MQRMNATSILTTSSISAQCSGGIRHIITKIGSDMMTVFGLSNRYLAYQPKDILIDRKVFIISRQSILELDISGKHYLWL